MKFKIVLCVLTFLIWVIAFIRIGNADESYQQCIQRCKADVMQIEECIEDERNHWTNAHLVSKRILRQTCRDLIRNERQYCYDECDKNEREG